MRKRVWAAGAGAMAFLAVQSAVADEPGDVQGWHASVTPYAWAPSLGGSITHGQIGPLPPGDLNFRASFFDIVSHLRGGFLGAGEARYNRMGAMADVDYLNVRITRPIRGTDVEVQVQPKTLISTVAGYYRVESRRTGSLDLVAGMRIQSLDNSITVTAPVGPLDVTYQHGKTRTVVDPVFGLRGTARLTDQWNLNGYGDVGGKSGSLTWQVAGGVGYKFNRHWSALIDLRYLSTSLYRPKSDMNIHLFGPMVGATYKF